VKSRLGYIGEAIAGSAVIAFTLLTPFLKSWHSRWGFVAVGSPTRRLVTRCPTARPGPKT
jgi:hypothetical protein